MTRTSTIVPFSSDEGPPSCHSIFSIATPKRATRLKRVGVSLEVNGGADCTAARSRPATGARSVEPRRMLNADVLALDLPSIDPGRQDHDLLVRLVDDIRVVENQSVTTQRIRSSIASIRHSVTRRLISTRSAKVSILGGDGNDRITIDTTSFANHDAPIVAFAGEGGNDTLSLTGNDAANWHIEGQGNGQVDGSLHVDFRHRASEWRKWRRHAVRFRVGYLTGWSMVRAADRSAFTYLRIRKSGRRVGQQRRVHCHRDRPPERLCRWRQRRLRFARSRHRRGAEPHRQGDGIRCAARAGSMTAPR